MALEQPVAHPARNVGHVYSWRTPWEHRALAGVNLRIDRGEALLVVGHNGSGKSTLVWILAGLSSRSEGDARIEGRPLSSVVGQVGVVFQGTRGCSSSARRSPPK